MKFHLGRAIAVIFIAIYFHWMYGFIYSPKAEEIFGIFFVVSVSLVIACMIVAVSLAAFIVLCVVIGGWVFGDSDATQKIINFLEKETTRKERTK